MLHRPDHRSRSFKRRPSKVMMQSKLAIVSSWDQVLCCNINSAVASTLPVTAVFCSCQYYYHVIIHMMCTLGECKYRLLASFRHDMCVNTALLRHNASVHNDVTDAFCGMEIPAPSTWVMKTCCNFKSIFL